jgi:HAD superfamily hydrolase (TIGR01509 family)
VTSNYWQIAVSQVEPTAGLLAFLDRISPLPKAVCTSAQRESARRMLDLLDLTSRFDAIITATDVTRGKPDPEPFQLAASRLNLAADSCIAFEDSANGLVSARAAGMYCVGVGAGATVYADLANVWISDFTDSELPRIMGI